MRPGEQISFRELIPRFPIGMNLNSELSRSLGCSLDGGYGRMHLAGFNDTAITLTAASITGCAPPGRITTEHRYGRGICTGPAEAITDSNKPPDHRQLTETAGWLTGF